MNFKNRIAAKANFSVMFIILLIVVGIAVCMFVLRNTLENKVDSLKSAISLVKEEYEFVRMHIKDIKNNSVEFDLHFIDIDGETTAKKQYALKGKDVFIECRVVIAKFGEQEKAFIFPYRLYSDVIAPEKGKNILNDYAKDNFPLIYNSSKNPDNYKAAVKHIFETAFFESEYYDDIKEKYIVKIFDTALHQAFFNRLKEGAVYSAVVHSNGAAQLTEIK